MAFDRETIIVDGQNEQLQKLEARTRCKRIALNATVGSLVGIIILEISLRFFEKDSDPLIIFTAQLLLAVIVLTGVTWEFTRLSNRVFAGEFKEEQSFFKRSLVVFLITYLIRSINVAFVVVYFDAYVKWMEGSPVWSSATQSVFHLLYDACPVIGIMLQHARTFEKEEEETTQVIMSTTMVDTTFNGDEDMTRFLTLRNLE